MDRKNIDMKIDLGLSVIGVANANTNLGKRNIYAGVLHSLIDDKNLHHKGVDSLVFERKNIFVNIFSTLLGFAADKDFYESKFVGWCKLDENMKEFLTPTKMGDICASITHCILEHTTDENCKFFLRIYFESV